MSPKARQAKGQARLTAYEKLLSQETEKVPRRAGDLHPARPAPGRRGHRLREGHQGLRRPAAAGGFLRQAAARLHRRRDRSQRGRQDHPAQNDHRAGEARQRAPSGSARRSSWPTPTSCARSTRRRPSGRRSAAGEDELTLGSPQDERPRLRGLVQLPGQRPAEEGRDPLRRRAQPRPPGKDPQGGRQRAAAGRADQRPGRQHAAGAGGGAGELRRLRRGGQPRPLVPGPHLPPTSWPSRATARRACSSATGATTKPTCTRSTARSCSRTGSSIGH